MEKENDSWFEDDELVRELLDDETPFFVLPEEPTDEANRYSSPSNNEDQATLKMVTSSAVYSGPTIEDIDNALSVAAGQEQYSQAISKARFTLLLLFFFFYLSIFYIYDSWSFLFYKINEVHFPFCRISLFEGGLGKIENKYTLKIKSWANGMADDGYKWRKYGQKSIKNSPNPRYINSSFS